jgi:hypothetical protein
MLRLSFKGAALSAFMLISISASCAAQNQPKLMPATSAILEAFKSHELVMLGETHGNKQEYDWLRSLVATPEFADRVDDIVMEFGNSLYQPEVDRYVSGQDIPLNQVQGAWLDTVASFGAPSPVYASLYKAVREVNMQRHGLHQIRILCGDPNIDWKKITKGTEVWPYLSNRDQSYAQVVEQEVIEKHHRAFLIMGAFHFLRNFEPFPGFKKFDFEHEFQLNGATTYLVVFGTNTTDYSGKEDRRFDSWSAPIIVSLAGNWVGDLPTFPVILQGDGRAAPTGPKASSPSPELKLKDAADALLYVGPLHTLTSIGMPASELDGTAYGREIERRKKIGVTPPPAPTP